MNPLLIEASVIDLWGYPLSYLELFGTIFNLISVILITRRNIWTWPTGIVGTTLFFFLFYQARLYSDMVEQVYFVATSIWGWWLWSKCIPPPGELREVSFSGRGRLVRDFVGMVAVSVLVGWGMTRVHVWLPGVFPEAAEFPYLDALTTVASFLATYLMLMRRTESWVYWIGVDVIGVCLYASKGLYLLAILYGIFLVLASMGLRMWLSNPGQQRPVEVMG